MPTSGATREARTTGEWSNGNPAPAVTVRQTPEVETDELQVTAPTALDAVRAEVHAHPIWSCRLLRACELGHLTLDDYRYVFGQYYDIRHWRKCNAIYDPRLGAGDSLGR